MLRHQIHLSMVANREVNSRCIISNPDLARKCDEIWQGRAESSESGLHMCTASSLARTNTKIRAKRIKTSNIYPHTRPVGV